MLHLLINAVHRTRTLTATRLAILVTAGFLAGCGGGGGGDASSATGSGGAPAPAPAPTACVGGANFQCSGDTILRTDNGVAMTAAGVQVYGRSTNDLATPIVNKTGAFGLAPASGGVAELRIAKDSNGAPSSPQLLLRNLGLSWDGRTERPLIVEAFVPTQGRTVLNANGAVAFTSLPESSNLDFYDFARRGTAGTQANYAGNRYFPRSGNPTRCAVGQSPCLTIETTGVSVQTGDWRSGGTTPDSTSAVRLHGDGDVHAGDGQPDANGNRTILPGGNGPGVPFPGSKGFRSLDTLSYQYSNLGLWLTQDTVLLFEWGGSDEHNKNRRGAVAFGALADAAAFPASGTSIYSGLVQGWYAGNATEDPTVFRGTVTVTVNFSTRVAVVTIRDTTSYDSAGAPVPATFTTTTTLGAGSSVNYFTGPVSGTLQGGVSGRFFGPTSSGSGPAELGGSFSLSNSSTGQTVVAGFIARKQ